MAIAKAVINKMDTNIKIIMRNVLPYLWLYNNAPITNLVRAFMNENVSITQLFDTLLTDRLDTPIFTDIAFAVIEGSEITKSIIFCPVRLTLLDASSPFSPNFFHLHRRFFSEPSPFTRYFLRVLQSHNFTFIIYKHTEKSSFSA